MLHSIYRHIIFLLLILCLPFVCAAQGQPFACDGTFFLSTSGGSTGSRMHRITTAPDGTVGIEEFPLNAGERRLTCLGMNVGDLLIYGLDFDTRELIRIDANGYLESLGEVENLNPDLQYFAGDISPRGGSLTVVGHNPQLGRDEIIYNIGLAGGAPYRAREQSLFQSAPIRLMDLATDPTRGVMYGFDGNEQRIVTINGGEVVTYAHPTIREFAGSLFFNREGILYGFGSAAAGSSESTLIQFDKNSGQARAIQEITSSAISDGCSCPYQVVFQRSISTPQVLPCSEFTIEYAITNHSGSSWLGLELIDELPPEFTIVAVEERTSTLSTIASGPGTNTLHLTNFDLTLGINRIRLRVRAGDNAIGTYTSQAFIKNLPPGLGENLPSDNEATPVQADPNTLTVVPPESFDFNLDIQYSCSGDSATLTVPFEGGSYRWSDGSTGRALTVSNPGLYWVEVENGCSIARDSVVLDTPPELLRVDLGEDRQARLGERLSLMASSNARGPLQYNWALEGGTPLSCGDCPAPELTATGDVTVFLMVTDERGCRASDTLHIAVDDLRQVFVPNAFSPDGDGINDSFFIQGTNVEVLALRVFNRWGTLVFEVENAMAGDNASGWDGRIAGERAETGIYVYTARVRFADGTERTYSGDLLLLR